MGLADRDYSRAPAPRPSTALVRIRALSATAWIIIACIAVFAIDSLVPNRLAQPVYLGDREFIKDGIDRSTALFPKPPSPPPPNAITKVVTMSIFDSKTQAHVGERTYGWMKPLDAWGHFSTYKGFFSLEVWRLVSFQFLHANINHIVMNCIGLFFFGPLVEQALRSRKRFMAFYLVCGVFGALMYLLLNLTGYLWTQAVGNEPPFALFFSNITTPLVGASAGIFGILMAAAYVAGNGTMYVFGIIPMRISTGAYLFTAISIANLIVGGQNAGGDAAHVGGAIAGFFFIRRMHLLRDFFDVLGSDGPRPPKRGKPKPKPAQEKLDAILDKVNQGGLHALSEKERTFLERETEERRQRGGQ